MNISITEPGSHSWVSISCAIILIAFFQPAKADWRIALTEDANQDSPVNQAGLYRDWWQQLANEQGVAVSFLSCAHADDCLELLSTGQADFAGPIRWLDQPPRMAMTRPVAQIQIVATGEVTSRKPDIRDVVGKPLRLDRRLAHEIPVLQSWKPTSVNLFDSPDSPEHPGEVVVSLDIWLPDSHNQHGQRFPLFFRWLFVYGNDAAATERLDAVIDNIDGRLDAGAALATDSCRITLPAQ